MTPEQFIELGEKAAAKHDLTFRVERNRIELVGEYHKNGYEKCESVAVLCIMNTPKLSRVEKFESKTLEELWKAVEPSIDKLGPRIWQNLMTAAIRNKL